MLNLELIRNAMTQVGLNQASLAEQCQVSRESVSNWLSGETMPRPNKLKLLANAIGKPMTALFRPANSIPEPIVAYRTQKNTEMSPDAEAAALDVARHLRQLVPFVQEAPLFVPPVLENPSLDDDYLIRVARLSRAKLGIGERDPLTRANLLELHQAFGSILVPVLWTGDLSGHENALSVLLPDTRTSFVIFSLNAKNDDFNYWLAHELGHCYSLHALRDADGEIFAERFAQELLFPLPAARDALERIQSSDRKLQQAKLIADAFDISVVTVIRQADKAAKLVGSPVTGLENDDFWTEWNNERDLVPTVAYSLFGSPLSDLVEYVERSEQYFGTNIFRAFANWQKQEGGRSPAFIAAALNIDLGQAFALSHVLAKRAFG